MSYNIDTTETLILNARMKAGDVRKFLKKEDNLPEGCFLNEMDVSDCDKDELIELPNLWWYGCGSGSSFDFFRLKVAPKIIGEVQAIFTWEGGESFSGIAIKDGRVQECEVIRQLELPEDW